MVKKAVIIIICIIVCTILIVMPWVLVLYGTLSKNPSDWGSFGGYIGGLLSPTVATFALFALLYTIEQQQIQIKLLGKSSAKEDLWRVIEKIESDFENTLKRYPIVIKKGNMKNTYSGLDIVSNITILEYKSAIVKASEVEKILKKPYSQLPQELYLYEMFGMAASQLILLKDYVEEYSKLAENKALLIYFHKKYHIPYQRFVEQEYITESWNLD